MKKSINDIHLNADNPRLIKDEKFQQLVKSIEEFPEMLELRPIIVDENMVILGGNMRYRASVIAGLTEVPVKVAKGLSEEQKQEFIIKDNVGFGEWDWDILGNEWNNEKLLEWGLDVWQDPEDEEPKDGLIDDDFIPEPEEPKVKKGDVWILGEHRLMCGDSTNGMDVTKLMNGEEATLLFTDPPYGVSYQGTNNPEGEEWQIIEGDKLRGEPLYELLHGAFKQMYDHSINNPALYVWHASRNQMIFESAMNDAGFEVKEQLIWNKGMVLSRSDHHWAHEPCFYARKKGFNNEWYGDRKNKTILQEGKIEFDKLKKTELVQIITAMQSESTVWEVKRDNVRTYLHPTQKPVELCMRALLNNTQSKDGVLDLFGGSGSTLIASEKLNRKSYTMELDPKYASIIVERWEQYTGQSAVKE
ncbi:MAG: putative modification methylase [Prokaryotic dsDNA virus sp.]|nr:MAG: putative modification methylase [Prokaryotic dsDNA virus sp.]|tara:strand:+ start:19131 stop:20381 length:1251 start_codon:yes stop_codon:yes gene_type:complete